MMDWPIGTSFKLSEYTGAMRERVEAVSIRPLKALLSFCYLDEYPDETPNHQLCGDCHQCTCWEKTVVFNVTMSEMADETEMPGLVQLAEQKTKDAPHQYFQTHSEGAVLQVIKRTCAASDGWYVVLRWRSSDRGLWLSRTGERW